MNYNNTCDSISKSFVAMFCYNCNKIGNHLSAHCNKQQMFVRCAHCDNVCLRENAHKPWCQNQDFRSTVRSPYQFARQSTKGFELWCSQEITHIMDGDVLKPITSDPILLTAENLILKKHGFIIKFYQLETDEKIRLSVGNMNGNIHLRILVEPHKFVVNNRVRVMADGTHTVRNIGADVSQAKLHMICANADRIKVRVFKFGVFDFFLSRNNVTVHALGAANGMFLVHILFSFFRDSNFPNTRSIFK